MVLHLRTGMDLNAPTANRSEFALVDPRHGAILETVVGAVQKPAAETCVV